MVSKKLDITVEMLEFKEAVRHTWNTHFVHLDNNMSHDIQKAFYEIERNLFLALVLSPIEMLNQADAYRVKSLSFIQVAAIPELKELPLQIGNREADGNTSWSSPENISVSNDSLFEFFDFFDWNPYEYIDQPYVRVKIAQLPASKKYEGKFALIEQRNVRFYKNS